MRSYEKVSAFVELEWVVLTVKIYVESMIAIRENVSFWRQNIVTNNGD